MSTNYTSSKLKKTKFSCFHAFGFISLVTLLLLIFTTNVYSAQVTVAWNPNSEDDLAGYKVYYGNSSWNYDTNIDVGYQTSYTISGLVDGMDYYITVTAYDFSGNESGYSNELGLTVNDPSTVIPATWVDLVNVTVNGNSITKTAPNAWGNGGAASLESFTGDGGVEFVATQTNTRRMCGLSSTNTDAYYASIEYAIWLSAHGEQIRVYENGVRKGEFGSYQIGDRFMVERVGSTIVYKKNGVIFYTSLTPAGSVLLVDCAIYDNGGEISDVNLIGITVIGGGPTDTTTPSTPDNLQVTAFSASQINLSWDASTDDVGVTGYRIYRDGTQIDTTASSTYQDTGLSASTTYSYTVSAYDATANESAQSTAASDTTQEGTSGSITWVNLVESLADKRARCCLFCMYI